MITRRWSEWVFAEYADPDGSIFGGALLRVVDEREGADEPRPQQDLKDRDARRTGEGP